MREREPLHVSYSGYFRPESPHIHGAGELSSSVVAPQAYTITSDRNFQSLVKVTGLSSSWTNHKKLVLKSITFKLDHVSVEVSSIKAYIICLIER